MSNAATSIPDRAILLKKCPSLTPPNSDDLHFWRQHVEQPLIKLMELSKYTVSALQSHVALIELYVLPALGPAARKEGGVWTFFSPSFMNDNQCPVELSLTWTKGRPSVRFSIEPIGRASPDISQSQANIAAAEELCQRLSAAGIGRFDRLRDLAAEVICDDEAESRSGDARKPEQESQVFIAFDLLHSGDAMVKAYVMPHARASRTSDPNLQIINRAVRRTGAAGQAWQSLLDYLSTLRPEEQPEAAILSTDCIDDPTARLKIYFRYRTMDIQRVVQHLTLGGATAEARTGGAKRWNDRLRQMWDALLSGDRGGRRVDEAEVRAQLEASCSEPTGGVLVYYDFSSSLDRVTAKVYLPVRHWTAFPNATIAKAVSELVQSSSGTISSPPGALAYEDMLTHLVGDSDLRVQNYVSLGEKKDGRMDVCVYLNPLPSSKPNNPEPEFEARAGTVTTTTATPTLCAQPLRRLRDARSRITFLPRLRARFRAANGMAL
ncbi:hypothetical protein OC842_000738 [Tilletia horrida]|uniref:Aromatic prenyltransferase n=1 Tax=Tilletia horrida TaxID=155126 RepID=A0AAN6JTU8_9BASI|nr:hypothetical protein OC842_000738 [Tilletia horrida]